MKKRLAVIFATVSAVMLGLFAISFIIVYWNAIVYENVPLALPAMFYLLFAWVPELLCSIAGIVFSVLAMIETLCMPKPAFVVSVITCIAGVFWLRVLRLI